MPRTLITAPGADLLNRSLGRIAVWWIENFVLVGGSGDAANDLVQFGDEYASFVGWCYALDESGHRCHNSAFFSRPKGGNKSGVAAYIALLEALGPARFDGWAEGGEEYTFQGRTYTYEPGEAMGTPVRKPLVRLMATEEGQVGNVYETVFTNLTEGPLAEQKAYGLDAGKSRILLPDGGTIIPSTAGASSKDGGLETFLEFDETHLYTTPTLRNMYGVTRRNLGKNVQGYREKWFLETSTMYAPGENSIAEQTYSYAKAIQEGRARRSKLLFDHRFAEMTDEQFVDKSDAGEKLLRAKLIEAYGEAIAWNNPDYIMDQIYDPRDGTSMRDAKRYYLNDIAAPVDAWVEPQAITPLLCGDYLMPGERITLGFDGAVTNDATALVACRVSDGLLVPLRIDECPDGPEAVTWSVDQDAFDAAVAAAFKEYDVVGFFADPPYWQEKVADWENEFGDNLRVKAGKYAIKFWTKNDSYIAPAVERVETAITLKNIRFPDRRDADDEVLPIDYTLRRHFFNARAVDRRGGKVIMKESKSSPKKIDAAMASVLAFEARARFLALAAEPDENYIPAFVR